MTIERTDNNARLDKNADSQFDGIANFVRSETVPPQKSGAADTGLLAALSPSTARQNVGAENSSSTWWNAVPVLAVGAVVAPLALRQPGLRKALEEVSRSVELSATGVARETAQELSTVGEAAERIAGLIREKAPILKGSVAMSNDLLRLHPQNGEGEVRRWYAGGSLAVNRLAQADRYVELDSTKLPLRVPLRTTEINPAAREHFLRFARKVGDADAFALGDKVNEFPQNPFDKHFPLDVLSDSARSILRPQTLEKEEFVFDDIPIPDGQDMVVAVQSRGKEFLVMDPRLLAARKYIHSLEQFGRGENVTKFADDFSNLFKAASALYSRDEVISHIGRVLDIERKAHPNSLFLHYHQPEFAAELGQITDGFLAKDPNVGWLPSLTVDSSRSIESLNVLARFKDEDKPLVIDFINRHKDQIENWQIVDGPTNRKAVAEHIIAARPDLRAQWKRVSDEHLAEEISGNITTLEQAAETMSTPLNRRPEKSAVMEALMKVDPANIHSDLLSLDHLFSLFDESQVGSMFRSDHFHDPAVRQMILEGARDVNPAALSTNDLEKFKYIFQGHATHWQYEVTHDDWRIYTPTDRVKKMQAAVDKFKALQQPITGR